MAKVKEGDKLGFRRGDDVTAQALWRVPAVKLKQEITLREDEAFDCWVSQMRLTALTSEWAERRGSITIWGKAMFNWRCSSIMGAFGTCRSSMPDFL